MAEKPKIIKEILKLLSDKQAFLVSDLKEKTFEITSENDNTDSKKQEYAITRSIKNMLESGLIETISSDQNDYARITKEGKNKLNNIKLDDNQTLLDPSWDGQWRIILLDLPESRKNERESLRYLLKKAGFICLKNSAWITPFPFEHLFENIKNDLNLSTEMMIIVTKNLDEETQKYIFKMFTK